MATNVVCQYDCREVHLVLATLLPLIDLGVAGLHRLPLGLWVVIYDYQLWNVVLIIILLFETSQVHGEEER